MKKSIFIALVLSLFFSSCNKHKKKDLSYKKDSISYYYRLSKNKKLDRVKRLKHINYSYKLIKLHKTDSFQLAILYKKIQIHYGLEQYDSVLHFNSQLFKKAKEINNNYYKAKYYYINSNYNEFILLKKDSAFSNTTKSLEYYKLLKDSSNIGKRYLDLAFMKNDIDDYFGSIESGVNALKYLSKKNDLKYVANSYNVIAYNYEDLYMDTEAIENYNLAISLAPTLKSKYATKNNLATFYTIRGDYKKSIQLLESINLDSVNSITTRALYEDNLAYSKWLNNPEEKIIASLKKNLEIKKNKNNLTGQVDSYEYMANYYRQNDIARATFAAQQLIKKSRILKHPKGELKGLKILMDINDNDLYAKNRYIKLKDSITLAHLTTRNQYAKIKHDNAKALKANKVLIKKNEHEKLLKSFYALLALITIIVLLFYLYYSYQKRKQINSRHEKEKLQTVYKTETDISKKIHDEIANGIYQVMMQAQNENNPLSEKSLDRLDEIYKRTRNFSHQISEINVNENYLNELQGMLEDYHSQETKIIVSGVKSITWNKISKIKKETIYRVLNELMVNMKKHSEARLVILKFEKNKKNIRISYSDNGVGIPKNQFVIGTGLKNMENRIHSIQGTFNFDTILKKGVQINIEFPS